MKYLRTLPWFRQVIVFFSFLLMISGFATYMLNVLLPKLTPYTLPQIGLITETSPYPLINTGIIVQGLFSLFTFLVPALLFAYFSHPNPAQYLGLRKPGKTIHWLLVPLIMLGAMPVLDGLESVISHINFGPQAKAMQALNDHAMTAFLTMPTIGAFVRTLVVMAVTPALGEELFFRGAFMRLAKKKTATMTKPILLTALTFALAHANIFGFLSIFLAGVLLAVIYYLTGSLWCSILAHVFFNGLQIVIAYFDKADVNVTAPSSSIPFYLVIAGAAIFGVSFYFLFKNKTPLPDNWADDFQPSELNGKGRDPITTK